MSRLMDDQLIESFKTGQSINKKKKKKNKLNNELNMYRIELREICDFVELNRVSWQIN